MLNATVRLAQKARVSRSVRLAASPTRLARRRTLAIGLSGVSKSERQLECTCENLAGEWSRCSGAANKKRKRSRLCVGLKALLTNCACDGPSVEENACNKQTAAAAGGGGGNGDGGDDNDEARKSTSTIAAAVARDDTRNADRRLDAGESGGAETKNKTTTPDSRRFDTPLVAGRPPDETARYGAR